MDIVRRNRVTVTGAPRGPVVVPAHGWGGDPTFRCLTVPAPAEDHRVGCDHVGSGRSDPSGLPAEAHASSDGCTRVVGCEALDPRDAVCAGHSAGAVSDVRASGVAAERAGAITDFPARLP